VGDTGIGSANWKDADGNSVKGLREKTRSCRLARATRADARGNREKNRTHGRSPQVGRRGNHGSHAPFFTTKRKAIRAKSSRFA